MAATQKNTRGRRRAPRKASSRRKKGTSAKRATSRRNKAQMGVLEHLESQLPPTLRGFSRRVNAALTRLESQFERAQVGSRKRAAATLRDASRKLGRLEATGEQGWRKLDEKSRKDAMRMLKKVESSVDSSGASSGQKTRKTARKAVRKTQRAMRSAASTLEP